MTWSCVCGSAQTPVCNCLLISLLALVILIRVGGLLLRVMSVRSISSSTVSDMVLGVVVFCFERPVVFVLFLFEPAVCCV